MSTHHNHLGKLRAIQPKLVWGARALNQYTSNLVNIADHEYVMPVGCNLLHLDNSTMQSRKTTIVDSQFPEVIQVNLMNLSRDGKYLATIVKMKDAEMYEINILIYHTSNKFQDSMKPRHIRHSVSESLEITEQVEINAMAFSPDAGLLVLAPSVPAVGLLVMDQFKGTIFQTIPLDNIPLSVSFHPNDDTKLCVTGENNLMKFWRFTAKSAHAAPVIGLKKGHIKYTTHEWLTPYTENTIIVGTSAGYIVPIQNCEQRAPVHYSFGNGNNEEEYAISQILIKGDNVIVASPTNLIVLYEVRRVVLSKGVAGLTAIVAPLACYKLNYVDRLCGLQFNSKESITSYALVGTSLDSVLYLDCITDTDLSGGNIVAKNANKTTDSGEAEPIVWTEMENPKTIFRFHAKGITSLSTSYRGKAFVTSSYEESSVRVWSLDNPTTFKSCWLVESFADRPDDNPFFVHMHPSGNQIAVANETEVKEYAITDSQLELIRKFGVRTPFQGSSGVPVVVTQPVSLVKYSNGGQLLAVVTGKIVQIFHVYRPEHDIPNAGDTPCRIIALCDHINPVTDVEFLREDNYIITISSDGSVYSWKVGSSTREAEYVQKGVPATHIAATKHHRDHCTIVVSFESASTDATPLANNIVNKRRQSSIAMRRMSRMQSGFGGFEMNRSHSNLSMGSGSQQSQDVSAAVAVFLNPNGQERPSTAYRQCFLAFWKDQINTKPTIIFLDTPIRSLAMGKTEGTDSFDVCVIGFVDGRIVISCLPMPLIQLNPTLSRPGSNPADRSASIFGVTAAAKIAHNLHNKRKNSMMGKTLEPLVEVNEKPSGNKHAKHNMSNYTIQHEHHNKSTRSIPPSASARSLPHAPEVVAEVDSPRTNLGDDSLSGDGTSTADRPGTAAYFVLDEEKCRTFRLLVGAITAISFTPDGSWIIIGGEDGSVHALSTGRKAVLTDDEDNHHGNKSFIMEPISNFFYMIEKNKMMQLRAKQAELEWQLDQSRKDNDMQIGKILEGKEKILLEVESKLKKEIAKRDEAIISGRKEYLSMKRSLQDEIDALKKHCEESLAAMELAYERKLAQESVYMDKMKQAYDEYVVHMRMDVSDLHTQTANKIKSVELEKAKAIHDAEKQKMAVLTYYEFIKKRHDEVLQSLEEKQAEERLKLKAQVNSSTALLYDSQQHHLSNEVAHTRAVARLNADVQHKDMEIMRVTSDIEWANERIGKLEAALNQSTSELRARSELVEKCETKVSEMTKRVEDLEKIRQTLTVQLNALKSDIGPKDKDLLRMSEQLQEMTREYEMALNAITEKEKTLELKSENLILLQKQVRELRQSAAQKESALNRSAVLLHEFVLAMHDARFLPRSKQQQPNHTTSSTLKVKEIKSLAADVVVNETTPLKDNKATVTIAATNATQPAESDALQTTQHNKTTKEKHHSTNDPNGIFTSLHLDSNVEARLIRLNDILKPFLTDGKDNQEYVEEAEAVRREQERHVHLLHKNLQTLQNSIETINNASHLKIYNHLTDNQTLLREVNNLRQEVKQLSLENQRLQASLEFQQARQAEQHAQLLQGLSNSIDGSLDHNNQSRRNTVYEQLRRASVQQGNGPRKASVMNIDFPEEKRMTPYTDRIDTTATSPTITRYSALDTKDSVSRDVNSPSYRQRNATEVIPPLIPKMSLGGNSSNQVASTSNLLSQKRNTTLSAGKNVISGDKLRGSMSSSVLPTAPSALNNKSNPTGPMTAEQKIAALIEMNADELRGLKTK